MTKAIEDLLDDAKTKEGKIEKFSDLLQGVDY